MVTINPDLVVAIEAFTWSGEVCRTQHYAEADGWDGRATDDQI